MIQVQGIGGVEVGAKADFMEIECGGDGAFRAGRDGVLHILTPRDQKIELLVYEDKTLVYIKSAMGYPALYPLQEARFEGPAEAVLMDLDGTSVHSEAFWMWIIEKTIARLMGDAGFLLEAADEPHVSGHSVSEHLQYCIAKYCPDRSVEKARHHYYDITGFEMKEILEGRGRVDAFQPAPGLKEFLLTLKAHKIRIGLVTSGLYEKAWPEILSAFRQLDLGDPAEFYDAIISAGQPLRKGHAGTLGELEPKPHPWLYAETARVGLGISPSQRHRVIGIEDSGAGVVSIRLAGFAAIGLTEGNIARSGTAPFVTKKCATLAESLEVILGSAAP